MRHGLCCHARMRKLVVASFVVALGCGASQPKTDSQPAPSPLASDLSPTPVVAKPLDPAPSKPAVTSGPVKFVEVDAPNDAHRAVLQQHLDKFDACYDQALKRDPETSAHWMGLFTLERDGKVRTCEIVGEPHQELRQCILRVINTLAFPKAKQPSTEESFSVRMEKRYRFTDPEKSFSVVFPGEPKLESEHTLLRDGEVEILSASLITDRWEHTALRDRASPLTQYDCPTAQTAMLHNSMETMGCEPTQVAMTRIGQFPALSADFACTQKGLKGSIRIVCNDSHLSTEKTVRTYSVYAFSDAKSWDPTEAQGFLDSLMLY